MNLKVKNKPAFADVPDLMDEVRRTEKALGPGGRVLLRYSGTEPKIRLLIEGQDQNEIEQHAQNITRKIQETIAK